MADVTKQLSANLLIKLPTGQLTLRAFGKTVIDIAQTTQVTPLSAFKGIALQYIFQRWNHSNRYKKGVDSSSGLIGFPETQHHVNC